MLPRASRILLKYTSITDLFEHLFVSLFSSMLCKLLWTLEMKDTMNVEYNSCSVFLIFSPIIHRKDTGRTLLYSFRLYYEQVE